MTALPLLSAEPLDNTLRFSQGQHGRVESYFLRANDPNRPRAFWLKATVLAPLKGPAVAEVWFIWFDGENNKTFAHRQTVPFDQAQFSEVGGGLLINAGGNHFRLAANGKSTGSMLRNQVKATWDLTWQSSENSIADRLSIFPWKVLRTGPFPKSKLLTPYPSLLFSGQIIVDNELIEISKWPGMQGHNWGKEHAFEYAWGQCLFPAETGKPDVMVEGFSGRIKLGKTISPRMSALVVRAGNKTYQFNTIFDYWRQQAQVDSRRWTVKLQGKDGVASLTMDAGKMPLACLGYYNPDGHLSYCLNTKLAHVWLHVQPTDGPAFSRESAHGGALEFLRHEPDPSIAEVI